MQATYATEKILNGLFWIKDLRCFCSKISIYQSLKMLDFR
jgi:hypothetical protein